MGKSPAVEVGFSYPRQAMRRRRRRGTIALQIVATATLVVSIAILGAAISLDIARAVPIAGFG